MTSNETSNLSIPANFSSNSSLELNLVDQLNSQLEILDEKEFNLPPVGELPTLESILNEEEDEEADEDILSMSDDENNINNHLKPYLATEGADAISVRSRGSSDSRSRNSLADHGRLPKKDNQSRNRSLSGSILRHIALKGIASQLVSAHDRVGAGLPTTMSVSRIICIGTSHGLILVFEPSQALKCCLGSTQLGEQHGAVSALAVNRECSRLLAGFSKGHLCLFDIINGKLLQNIPDAHTPFTSVLHIKWTDFPGMALISDCGGSVFELSVKRTMGLNSNESRCIFSGSRGEVCSLEPLIMGHFLNLPPIINTVIVAMATISKVIVVSLRPYLRVLFSQTLTGSSSTLPLLSWQFVIIQMPDGAKVIDPVLAFARDATVFFFQLTHSSYGHLTFIPLQRITVPYTLQSLLWLNSRTMATIDTKEKLHVIDVKNQEELDVVDLARLGLVYASSHFKGIATGGNVSKAMVVAGDRACYNSVATFGAQILLLGTKSFQVVTLRTWAERVDYLVKENCTKEALYWLIEVLHNKAQAVIGLTHKKPRRNQLLLSKIQELLHQYLEKTILDRPDTGNAYQLANYYQNVVPSCVRVAVEAGFKDIVFSKLWDSFSDDVVSRGIFLESLEPYIMSNEIKEMSPSISQCLLSHYEDKGYLEAIEACIVRLDIASLDLHQAMTLCWAHGLYDAIFYVYTRGMRDYVSPLEELLMVLKNSLDSNTILTDVQIALGNKILVYVSCCLAGRAYPHGDIDSEEVKKVKHEVFKCITSLHTKNATDTEHQYPFLRTLLRFDTREFLNVLALAFEEEEFTSELGLVQRQRIVDILMQVMVNGDGFDMSQIVSLFIFVSRQISRKGICVSRSLIEQVLDHLTSSRSDLYHEERENSLLELIQAGALRSDASIDVVSKAEKAQFYRVCEHIYEESGNYDKIMECYVKDRIRCQQVFNYIQKNLRCSLVVSSHRDAVKRQILNHVESLIAIEAPELANLLLHLQSISHLISEIVQKIHSDKQLCYTFLQAIFTARSNYAPNKFPSTERKPQDQPEEAIPDNRALHCLAVYKSTNNIIEDDSCDHIIFPQMLETYIELMCDIDSSQVCGYLQSVDGYRLDETLKICRDSNLDEATAYILERKGNQKEAFEIHIKILKGKIRTFMSDCDKDENANSPKASLNDLRNQVTNIVKVCQSGSQSVSEGERKDMWFPLLDLVLSIQPSTGNRNGLSAEVRSVIGHIVNSMVGHISLPVILERIMMSPGYSDCSFGQIKHLLKDMVERYTYDGTLYSTVVRILHGDQLRYLAQMMSQSAAPLAVSSTLCALCSGFYHPASKAIVYSCGHSYHVSCGGEESDCLVCLGSTRSTQKVTSELEIIDGSLSNKMDQMQLDGLKRVSILDANTARLALSEDLFSTGKVPNSKKKLNEGFSHDFVLNLAPKNLMYEAEDI